MDCNHLLNCHDCASKSIDQSQEEVIGLGWYWACAEYTEDGWSGPFETRELAEAHAKSTDDDAPTEFSYLHFGNVGKLEAEIDRLRAIVCSTTHERVTKAESAADEWREEAVRIQLLLNKLSKGCLEIGSWMSAALGDEKVCAEMKDDIQLFFDSWPHQTVESIAAHRNRREVQADWERAFRSLVGDLESALWRSGLAETKGKIIPLIEDARKFICTPGRR